VDKDPHLYLRHMREAIANIAADTDGYIIRPIPQFCGYVAKKDLQPLRGCGEADLPTYCGANAVEGGERCALSGDAGRDLSSS